MVLPLPLSVDAPIIKEERFKIPRQFARRNLTAVNRSMYLSFNVVV
jgi:hypothetical protein